MNSDLGTMWYGFRKALEGLSEEDVNLVKVGFYAGASAGIRIASKSPEGALAALDEINAGIADLEKSLNRQLVTRSDEQ